MGPESRLLLDEANDHPLPLLLVPAHPRSLLLLSLGTIWTDAVRRGRWGLEYPELSAIFGLLSSPPEDIPEGQIFRPAGPLCMARSALPRDVQGSNRRIGRRAAARLGLLAREQRLAQQLPHVLERRGIVLDLGRGGGGAPLGRGSWRLSPGSDAVSHLQGSPDRSFQGFLSGLLISEGFFRPRWDENTFG